VGVMSLRGRPGSVIASWQEMNRGFNHGQQNNTTVGGNSLFRGTFGNTQSLIDPAQTQMGISEHKRSRTKIKRSETNSRN
jgi:hypothetical protein